MQRRRVSECRSLEVVLGDMPEAGVERRLGPIHVPALHLTVLRDRGVADKEQPPSRSSRSETWPGV